jgi:hypothetical protein
MINAASQAQLLEATALSATNSPLTSPQRRAYKPPANWLDAQLSGLAASQEELLEAARVDQTQDERQRRRRLLQTDPAVAARQLKELVFDEALRVQSLEESLQFIDSWGRAYGRFNAIYAITSDTCNQVDAALKTLKEEIITEFKPLLMEQVSTTTLLQAISCSLVKITWTPGELTQLTQTDLLNMFHVNILLEVERSAIVQTAVFAAPLLIRPSQFCLFDFADMMFRQTQVSRRP